MKWYKHLIWIQSGKILDIDFDIDLAKSNVIINGLNEKFKLSIQEDKKKVILSRLNDDENKNALSKALRRYIISLFLGKFLLD